MNEPKLVHVMRLDSLPMDQTYFTPEGYFIDRPILTSTGIFEYHNTDGSIRRELRLPEEVFAPESLKSYRAKPVVISHDAGLINKDNVADHEIGTILSDGYRSGDSDVRAEICIHDTDDMKRSGYKQLSLGYNLDLDETPGEWNGQHYDAIQRNIRINHLALVKEARAGDQARLNLDSRDNKTLIGGKAMAIQKNVSRADGILSPEELEKAIAEYKAKHAANKDGDDKSANATATATPVSEPAKPTLVDTGKEPDAKADGDEPVKDETKTPDDTAAADLEAIRDAHKDGDDADIQKLLDIIDTLIAEREFKKDGNDCEGKDCANTDGEDNDAPAEGEKDGGKKPDEVTTDGDDDAKPADGAPADGNVADDKSKAAPTKLNADSADAIDELIRQRIKVGMVGRKLNLDGLEDMQLTEAKKAVIHAVRPGIRLDGKSDKYIDAAYDLAVDEANRTAVKDTAYQMHQMFNKDSADPKKGEKIRTAAEARQAMIDRMNKKEDK